MRHSKLILDITVNYGASNCPHFQEAYMTKPFASICLLGLLLSLECQYRSLSDNCD